MSVSYNVYGIKPADERWLTFMRARWNKCTELDIKIPKEVINFFEGKRPDKDGRHVKIPCISYTIDYGDGFEVDLNKVPYNVEKIRFEVNY